MQLTEDDAERDAFAREVHLLRREGLVSVVAPCRALAAARARGVQGTMIVPTPFSVKSSAITLWGKRPSMTCAEATPPATAR